MKQQLFYFEAEHVTRSNGLRLVRELEDKLVEVEAAAMDPNFTDTFHMIITATEEKAKEVRDKLWFVNRGASCDMHVTTKTELDW